MSEPEVNQGKYGKLSNLLKDATRVRWNEQRGVASLLEGRLLPWDPAWSGEPEKIVCALLGKYGNFLGPTDAQQNFRIMKSGGWEERPGKTGPRVRAYQIAPFPSAEGYLPVFDASLFVFADERRGIHRVLNSFWSAVPVSATVTIGKEELSKRLLERLRGELGNEQLDESKRDMDSSDLENFPLIRQPRLCFYPVADGFHPAYHARAYQPWSRVGSDGRLKRGIARMDLMVDATSGGVLWLLPTREFAQETAESVEGEPEGGVVIRSAGGQDIGKRKFTTLAKPSVEIPLRISRDEQKSPEQCSQVFAEKALTFYRELGWEGFDDGLYGPKPSPVQVAVNAGKSLQAGAFEHYTDRKQEREQGFILFFDGAESGQGEYGFFACDPVVFGHEYQHAVTYFGAYSEGEDGRKPGHLKVVDEWFGALREGLSDAFGFLFSEWLDATQADEPWMIPAAAPRGALRRGEPFRRADYPRSPYLYHLYWCCDHFDDRSIACCCRTEERDKYMERRKYYLSTLLSHLAYLTGRGGVHQRAARGDAELIPVSPIGMQRTAGIFLSALTGSFAAIPSGHGEKALVEAADYLLCHAEEAASNGKRSSEYVMMRRALYAMGLHPYDEKHNKQRYGGEACMLPWTWEWRLSQPYLGLPAHWWKSPDLFVHNPDKSPHVVRSGENKLFARVRNIGDGDLENIRVRFFYHPLCTNLPIEEAGWKPCKADRDGGDSLLVIRKLAAGTMNFRDADAPPENQSARWYLPSGEETSAVSHFSLRAVIDCQAPNHENDHRYEVRSSVIVLEPAEGPEHNFSFLAWCPEDENTPSGQTAKRLTRAALKLEHTLPKGYAIETTPELKEDEIALTPGETRVTCRLKLPPNRPGRLEAPYEGTINAVLKGLDGTKGRRFDGVLSKLDPAQRASSEGPLTGTLSGSIGTGKRRLFLHGTLRTDLPGGAFNPDDGSIEGWFYCNVTRADGGEPKPHRSSPLFLQKGRLEPLRVVHFTQYMDGKAVGGVTVIVKEPEPAAAKGH